MSPKEYSDKIRGKIEALRTRNKPFEIAVRDSVARVVTRAFSGAQNEKGEKFQYNDTKPVYIREEDSPRKLSRKGKTGKDTFESGAKKGKRHETTYFESYKAFRAAVGADTDAVDWQITNDLRSDYSNLSKDDPTTKIDVNRYITAIHRPFNQKKYNGLVKRYGNFLQCSEKEVEEFYRILDLELGKFLAA